MVAWGNLAAAARTAARGKRTRPDVAAFLLDLEGQVCALRRELLDGSYRPGGYRTFVVREPKRRLISAAAFRDRVVHHALTRVLEPVFERRFSSRSFACRKGFGTHAALGEVRRACRRFRYVLRCDVMKYFASIDHAILLGLLRRVIACERTLDLASRIIAGSNPQEPMPAYFPGDDLFTPFERRRGLPLGNQTSQFFANVYLDPLDQLVARRLRPGAYARYCDDFVLFADDKVALAAMRDDVVACLGSLRLRLHPRKSRVYRTADGVTWLGFRVFPGHVRLVRANVVKARRRLRWLREAYAQWRLDWPDVRCRVRAWIAHAAHGNTWRLRSEVLGSAIFVRGGVA
ncbi:MAG: reverse transcriptase/maturase family protein [Thermoanaerobaculaceae bacterium]|nr:reverse transcriptase/maturase family protein [Thermoanaerobaculaceae bacterium]